MCGEDIYYLAISYPELKNIHLKNIVDFFVLVLVGFSGHIFSLIDFRF